MIITIMLAAKYMSMSELETDCCTIGVGAGEFVAMLTVAYVEAEDV